MKNDTEAAHYAQRAMEHVRFLAEEIGPRPSTRNGERLAAKYALRVLEEAGLCDVRSEEFQSATSTYRPYLLAFGAAMIGNGCFFWKRNRASAALAAGANIAAAIGFAREASLQANWMRRVLQTAQSQNVIGVVRARGEVKRRIVVLGHLDSHRTPLVYSHPRWLRVFSTLVSLGFGSLIVNANTHALAATRKKQIKNKWLRGLNVFSNIMCALVQSACIALLIEADCTPHSPGANDNASGAATVLALAERAIENPFQNTEVWFVGTGCEEVGCYGIAALLDAHGSTPDGVLHDALFLNFDMVGIGAPSLLTREGLLKASHPDAQLLQAAQEVAAKKPGLISGAHAGGAYTDNGMISARGFAGITIDSQIPPAHPASARMGFWHQKEDAFENIELDCLRKTHEFGWELLRHLDAAAVHNSSQSKA